MLAVEWNLVGALAVVVIVFECRSVRFVNDLGGLQPTEPGLVMRFDPDPPRLEVGYAFRADRMRWVPMRLSRLHSEKGQSMTLWEIHFTRHGTNAG